MQSTDANIRVLEAVQAVVHQIRASQDIDVAEAALVFERRFAKELEDLKSQTGAVEIDQPSRTGTHG